MSFSDIGPEVITGLILAVPSMVVSWGTAKAAAKKQMQQSITRLEQAVDRFENALKSENQMRQSENVAIRREIDDVKRISQKTQDNVLDLAMRIGKA